MPLPHPPFHFSEMVSPPMCQQSLTHQIEAGPRPYPQYLGWARYLSVNNSCPDGLLWQMALLKAVQCSSFAFFLRQYVSLTDNHICEVYQLTFSRCCTAEIMVQHLSEMKHCCWIQPRGKHLRAPKLQQFMTCSTWAFWGWLLPKWAEALFQVHPRHCALPELHTVGTAFYSCVCEFSSRRTDLLVEAWGGSLPLHPHLHPPNPHPCLSFHWRTI